MEEVVSSPPLDKLTERKRPLTAAVMSLHVIATAQEWSHVRGS